MKIYRIMAEIRGYWKQGYSIEWVCENTDWHPDTIKSLYKEWNK